MVSHNTSVRLSDEQRADLDEMAAMTGLSRSALLEWAIETFIALSRGSRTVSVPVSIPVRVQVKGSES